MRKVKCINVGENGAYKDFDGFFHGISGGFIFVEDIRGQLYALEARQVCFAEPPKKPEDLMQKFIDNNG